MSSPDLSAAAEPAGWFHALVRAIPDIAWLKDVAGAYVACNGAFERHLGVLQADLVGRTARDFIGEEQAQAFASHDRAALTSARPTIHEEWLDFAAEGGRGLFQTTRTAMRDADGKLIGLLGVARDITVRKESESQLLASELRYRRLFESAKDGILILDAGTGRVMDVNPYLVERLGFTREEFLGKAIWELGFFRDIIANKASFEELQRNEYVRYDDKPLRTAAGRQIDVEFVSNVYLVNHEKVIQCNIRDITARKLADRQLREQNEILSNSHEGVVIVGLDNRVSFWNPAAGLLFGWTSDEALGRSPEELLGLGDPAAMTTVCATVHRDGFWNGEVPAQTRDGRKLILDCGITLVHDEAGRPRARLKIFADITAKKQLEQKFLRVQRLEAIGTLSGGIAHDLNNILSPILMAAGLLREKLPTPADRELMGLIENASRRGANVIRQLLTFSRGIEGERANVQLRHLIREVVDLMRETFPRNLVLVEKTGEDLWPVVADATQLHQVLMNLCVNARDAMPAGGTLTITTRNVQLSKHANRLGANALDGPYVLLTVGDTGPGIPREIIDRIFEPFFTTKALGQGTGLGLSTVLGIVRSHGGLVTAYSEPGHGSVFQVYLPAAPCALIAAGETAAAAPADGGGEVVLVVDDEAAIVAGVRLCLEEHGYRVVAAKDGREALALFAAHQPPIRLVVTDVMMPVMDGLELAHALRARDANVRVIASSGLDMDGRSGEIAAGYIREFLNKPYEPRALLAAVARQLKQAARPPE